MYSVAVGIEHGVVVQGFSSRVNLPVTIVTVLPPPVITPETADQAEPVTITVFYWEVTIGKSVVNRRFYCRLKIFEKFLK